MKLTEEQLRLMRHNLAMAMHFISVKKTPRRKEEVAYFIQQVQMIINQDIYREPLDP